MMLTLQLPEFCDAEVFDIKVIQYTTNISLRSLHVLNFLSVVPFQTRALQTRLGGKSRPNFVLLEDEWESSSRVALVASR